MHSPARLRKRPESAGADARRRRDRHPPGFGDGAGLRADRFGQDDDALFADPQHRRQRRNVVTIEDPVEIQVPGVTQIPVRDDQEASFPQLLRSVLRQDPDVILVGEIRDAETARVGMQAAVTGHLVFSTVHTKDTIGCIFRLLDLGVEAYLVAQGLHLVLAQRLARQLCPYCKKPYALSDDQHREMGSAADGSAKFTGRSVVRDV